MNRTSILPARPLAPPPPCTLHGGGGTTLSALGLCLVAGCGNPATDATGNAVAYDHQAENKGSPVVLPNYQYVPTGPELQQSPGQASLSDGSIDYGLALRSATIKLRGDLPTLKEIRQLQAAVAAGANDGSANDPYAVYKGLVYNLIYNSPATFNVQMVNFWRTTLRLGGTLQAVLGTAIPTADPTSDPNVRTVSLETGPALAAMLVANDVDMRQLFQQATGNCPTFNAATGMFAPGNCNTGAAIVGSTTATVMGNGVQEGSQAGILTDAGFMAQFYSNMGMRRGRALEEIFACQRFPAEYAASPVMMTSFLYSSPWNFHSITDSSSPPTWTGRAARGKTTTTTTAVTGTQYVPFDNDCQNCHSTQNHRVPMFGVFDAVGFKDPNNVLRLVVPVAGSPFAQMQDFLPVGQQQLMWKYGNAPLTPQSFQAFGAQMAADQQVINCFMIRAWNNAYGRGDVAIDLSLVPQSVTANLTAYFMANGYNMKKALLKLYTDPSFIRFF